MRGEAPQRPRERLRRSIAVNVAGLGPPLLFAVLALPILTTQLGAARLGILLIGWTALTYLGMLNLGVGRALVQATARRDPADGETATLVRTAVLLLLAVGAAGGVLLFACAPLLAGVLAGGQAGLQAEATTSFRVLAAAVPFTVSSAALMAVLEARRRFSVINTVAIPLAAVNWFGPVAALSLADSLAAVMAVLVAGRVAAWLVWLGLAGREVPGLLAARTDAGVRARLLRYGGWVTVSHVVSPLMTYADRFVIGVLVSASAVAWYAAPQEMVIRFAAVAGAISAVLFAAFAGAEADERPVLLERGLGSVFALMLPAAVGLAAFGAPVLSRWMGPEYGAQGGVALPWLALGLLANGVARVPAAYLMGAGRPDLTGRLHLAELPCYALALWLLTARFGLAGAAAAWCLRAAVDAGALLWLTARHEPRCARAVRRAALGALAGAACVVAPLLADPLTVRAALGAALLGGMALLGWRGVVPGLHFAATTPQPAPDAVPR